jgi:hypothetical protein
MAVALGRDTDDVDASLPLLLAIVLEADTAIARRAVTASSGVPKAPPRRGFTSANTSVSPSSAITSISP